VLNERLSLTFGGISISFYPQKADGSVGAPIQTGWDVKSNKKI
jgi:hypothetical protein